MIIRIWKYDDDKVTQIGADEYWWDDIFFVVVAGKGRFYYNKNEIKEIEINE